MNPPTNSGKVSEGFRERLEKILDEYYPIHSFAPEIGQDLRDDATKEILSLIESIVPKVKWTGKAELDGRFYKDWTSPEDDAWNDCRQQFLSNLKGKP